MLTDDAVWLGRLTNERAAGTLEPSSPAPPLRSDRHETD
jgi:hypothetical protein